MRKSLVARVFIAVLPIAIVGGYVLATRPRFAREKGACEAQGRFYWRGHCLPTECEVVYP